MSILTTAFMIMVCEGLHDHARFNDHAMPSETTRSETDPDIQETLSESLQKGFSQLTKALSFTIG